MNIVVFNKMNLRYFFTSEIENIIEKINFQSKIIEFICNYIRVDILSMENML